MAREFWISNKIPGLPRIVQEQWPMKYAHQFIHVREVRPGEIALTREELRAACLRTVSGDVFTNDLIDALVRVLWPESLIENAPQARASTKSRADQE